MKSIATQIFYYFNRKKYTLSGFERLVWVDYVQVIGRRKECKTRENDLS
jgi:hypothetical protein